MRALLLAFLLVSLAARAGEFEAPPPSAPGANPFVRMVFNSPNPSNPSSCSHTLVSNEGHILTALHCITACLEGAGRFENDAYVRFGIRRHDVPGTIYKHNPFVVYEINEEKLAEMSCELDEGQGGERARARILAVGARGYVPNYLQYDFRAKHPEPYEEIRRQGYTGVGDVGDFALLQLEAPPAAARAYEFFRAEGQCLPLDPAGASPGETVWNYSYPHLGTRKGMDKFAYLPLASAGKVFTRQSHPAFQEESLSDIDARFLYASTDVEIGSSGSAQVSARGKVAGVTVMSISSREKFTPGSSIFLPTPLILDTLRRKLGAPFVERLLHGCKVPAATAGLVQGLLKIAP